MKTLQQRIIDEFHVRPTIDPAQEVRRRVDFLKEYLISTGMNGYVLGISGGQDSTLAGKLAQQAVRELRLSGNGCMCTLVALRLPYGKQADEEDAQNAVSFVQPDKIITIDIKPAVDISVSAFEKATGYILSDLNKGNIKSRERMKMLYAVASHLKLLVIGTGNAAESVTGFFTKWGDAACDVAPLAGLTKRQVGEMLMHLGASRELYEKTPTADLLDCDPLQPDEVALGVSYEHIDTYLTGNVVPMNSQKRIETLYNTTQHKRFHPVTPNCNWWRK